MNRFSVVQALSAQQASTAVKDRAVRLSVIKAGGMDVVDHLKEGLESPDRLVNILPVTESQMRRLESGHIGALATLAQIANSPVVQREAPVIAQACGSAATPQVRNVATAAGNLLQRPRCWYYRNDQFHCLKKGGHTCYAVEGENDYHAIFGDGPCHIVHPSNLAPALNVCNGTVHVIGGDRETIDINKMFHVPDEGLQSEHNLEQGEVITHMTFERRPTSAFYAVKHKQSFDWPLVCAAVALQLDGNVIQAAEICAGAVAPIPWRLPGVENALQGVSVDDDAALKAACERSTRGARPMSGNAYKLRLLPVTIRRAIRKAAGREVEA